MFNITLSDTIKFAIAAILVAVGVLFDFIDLDFSHLVGNGLVAVAAGTIGVLLAGRSQKARDFADDMYHRAKAAAAELRKHGIKLPE